MRAIAYGEDSLWLVTGANGNQIERLDPATNAVIASFPLERLGRSSFGSYEIKVGSGVLWTLNGDDPLAFRIDPDTGHVLGVATYGCGPINFVLGARAIWVPCRDDTLVRLEPASGRAKRLRLGAAISREFSRTYAVRLADVAAGEGAVWVGTAKRPY